MGDGLGGVDTQVVTDWTHGLDLRGFDGRRIYVLALDTTRDAASLQSTS